MPVELINFLFFFFFFFFFSVQNFQCFICFFFFFFPLSNADINTQNNRGDTPLHLACYRGFTDIVSLLVDYGADVTLENNQGKTPYVEADSQKHRAVLKILQPLSKS